MKQRDDGTTTVTPPKIKIPEYVPPTKEELARRKRLVEEADRIRAEIGPIDIRTDDLLHLARSESAE